MQSSDDSAATYPKLVDLAGEDIQVRLLTSLDATKLHDFFLALPPADLLFLQRDVTDGAEIDAWMKEVEEGETITLLADAEGAILGETTLRRNRVPWARHVGTVRVVTDAAQRGRGLGRLLLQEMFALAASKGVEKIVAEMTVEQTAAMNLFVQLGFQEEGRFRSYVKDRGGTPHDLVVMTYNQPALTVTRPATPAARVPWRCDSCGHVTPASEPPQRCPDCGASGEMMTLVEATDAGSR